MSRAECIPALKGLETEARGNALGLPPPKPSSLERAEDDDLPKGWQHQQLDDLCELVKDQIQPSAAAGMPYVGLEHIDPGEPMLRRWGDPKNVRSTKTRFAPSDILYGKLRPYLDKAVLAPFAGICSTDILVFRAQADRAIAEFLVSAIHTKPFLGHAVSTTAGVNHPRTSWSALKVHALAAPPLPEQRAIAAMLRTVQQAKEACERVLAAMRQLKQSLLHHLFTYGPVPFPQAAHVPLKETEIGPMPEHWDTVQLGTVAAVRTSTSPVSSILRATAQAGGRQILFLKVSDLNHPANQRRVVTSAATFSVDEEGQRALKLVPEGAIVLPKRGAAIATNKKRLTTCGCLLDPNLVGVIPGPQLVSDYFYAWFERFDLRTITDTSTLPQINKKDLEPLQIPLPPLPEQREIAAQLSAVDAKLAAEESRRSALAVLFQSLLHHLMTGKVRLPEFITNQTPK